MKFTSFIFSALFASGAAAISTTLESSDGSPLDSLEDPTSSGGLRGSQPKTADTLQNDLPDMANGEANGFDFIQAADGHRSLLAPADHFPSLSGFYGGSGGATKHLPNSLLSAGRITRIEGWKTTRNGHVVLSGLRFNYDDGRGFSVGHVNGQFEFFDIQPDDYIVRITGRTGSVFDGLRVETKKGRSYKVGNPYGGKQFDTGYFPAGKTLRLMKAKTGSVIDALGFAIGSIPEPESTGELEISHRRSSEYGGRPGIAFEDLTALNGKVLKLAGIQVYEDENELSGLTIDYLMQDGTTKTRKHGDTISSRRVATIGFNDSSLKNIEFSIGDGFSKVTEIVFEDSKGRAFGPFGKRTNDAVTKTIASRDDEAILSLFGRKFDEDPIKFLKIKGIKRLGVVHQRGALERVEITGPFVFGDIQESVGSLEIDNQATGNTLQNCDPDTTSGLTGAIELGSSVSFSETFSQSTVFQTDFELSRTQGVSAGAFGIGASVETTLTVGTSFSVEKGFETTNSSSDSTSFTATATAQPGEIVQTTSLLREIEYSADYILPVNFFFVSNPGTPVAGELTGTVEGSAIQNQVVLETTPCP